MNWTFQQKTRIIILSIKLRIEVDIARVLLKHLHRIPTKRYLLLLISCYLELF